MQDTARRQSEPTEPTELSRWEVPLGRRAFLGTLALGLGGLFVLSTGLARGLSNAAQAIKPGGGWRIYTVSSPMPVFNPDKFELKITGLVDKPMTLSWADITKMPGRKQVSDFHCVTGWSVDNVHWEGIEPSHIIDLVKPRANARFVTAISAEEPYVDQISIDQFLLPDTLLARHMDGKLITREHGAPLRLVIPAMYGYKGVKWVRELRFDERSEAGYWEQRGYDTDAFVGKSNGRS